MKNYILGFLSAVCIINLLENIIIKETLLWP